MRPPCTDGVLIRRIANGGGTPCTVVRFSTGACLILCKCHSVGTNGLVMPSVTRHCGLSDHDLLRVNPKKKLGFDNKKEIDEFMECIEQVHLERRMDGAV